MNLDNKVLTLPEAEEGWREAMDLVNEKDFKSACAVARFLVVSHKFQHLHKTGSVGAAVLLKLREWLRDEGMYDLAEAMWNLRLREYREHYLSRRAKP